MSDFAPQSPAPPPPLLRGLRRASPIVLRLIVIFSLYLIEFLDRLLFPIEFDVSRWGFATHVYALLLGVAMLLTIELLNRGMALLSKCLNFPSKTVRYLLVAIMTYFIAGLVCMNMNRPSVTPIGEFAFAFSSRIARPVRVPGDVTLFASRVSVLNHVFFPVYKLHGVFVGHPDLRPPSRIPPASSAPTPAP